ncbi:MAG: amidohydrolase family protein [Pirellulales bacterium]
MIRGAPLNGQLRPKRLMGGGLRLTACLLLAAASAHADDAVRPIVVEEVTVVDVESGQLLPHRTVMVDGAKIAVIAASHDFKAPEGALVIPGAGKYLIPGLWDMHVHLEQRMPALLDLFLANGVTGIRDLNSEAHLFEWRDEIQTGKRLGPRIVASGLYLDAARSDQPPTRPAANTPEQARELVRQRKLQGVDLIKVYSGLRPDVYRAIVEEAQAQHLPVAGHCPEMVPAGEASALGQRSIEHLTGIAVSTSRKEDALRKELREAFTDPRAGYDTERMFRTTTAAMETPDDKKRAELFDLFKRNRTWQVPTLIVQRPSHAAAEPDPRMKYMHPVLTQLWSRIQGSPQFQAVRKAQFEYAQPVVRALHEAGAPILAGSDCGAILSVNVYPGFSLADELALLVDCGLAAADALRAATLNPALYLGEEETCGTVAVGKVADLVLLDADPLADIGNVRKIAGVMVRGQWLPRAELDRMLSSAAQAASE